MLIMTFLFNQIFVSKSSFDIKGHLICLNNAYENKQFIDLQFLLFDSFLVLLILELHINA